MIRIEPAEDTYHPGLWIDEQGNVIGTTISLQQRKLFIITPRGIKQVYLGVIDCDGNFYQICEESFETCKTPCKLYGTKGCRLNPMFDFVGYYIEDSKSKEY